MPCKNAAKAHLWRLPDRAEPAPRYATSGKVLMLWPLFHIADYDGPDPRWGTVVHHGVRGAVWSRQSFLLHTDAISAGVECKFYVEARCMEAVTPIFEANAIDIDTEVITFDAQHLQGEPRTCLGPSHCAYVDERFCDYEWIGVSDFDLFCSTVGGVSKHFPLFSRLVRLEPQILAVETVDVAHPFSEIHWWRNILEITDTAEAKQAAWMQRASQLVPEPVLRRYREGKVIPKPHGCFFLYPMRFFWQTYPERVAWIEEAGRALQDDEAVFSLFGAQWGIGSVSELLDVPFTCNIEGQEESRMRAAEISDGFYLSHIPTLIHVPRWQFECGIPISAELADVTAQIGGYT